MNIWNNLAASTMDVLLWPAYQLIFQGSAKPLSYNQEKHSFQRQLHCPWNVHKSKLHFSASASP